MSVTSTNVSPDRLERPDKPFSEALAEYQRAVLERDRLGGVKGGKPSPELAQAVLAELDAWGELGRLRFG